MEQELHSLPGDTIPPAGIVWFELHNFVISSLFVFFVLFISFFLRFSLFGYTIFSDSRKSFETHHVL